METSPLKSRLISNRPRESSGSRASNRFAFQQSWALCRLIQLHQAGEDYVVVLDYHDDILVLNCSQNPTAIDFYQIKTESKGNWTVKRLTTREQGQSGPLSSPLGKLVQNKLTFPTDTRSLNFITSHAFKLALKDKAEGVLEAVTVSELSAETQQTILKALQDEHSLAEPPDCVDCLNLEVTPLSVKAHQVHAMGELTEFLASVYPGEKLHFPVIYRSLADEIKRRSNVESLPTDFDSLCTTKGISRGYFDGILRDVRPDSRFKQTIDEVVAELRDAQFGYDEVRKVRSACETYEVDRMDASNAAVRKARATITAAVEQRRKEGPMPVRLVAALGEIEAKVDADTRHIVALKSREYRSAMIIMALYDF